MGKVYRHKYLYIPSKYIRHLSIRSPCKSLPPTKCYSLIEIFPRRDTPKPSLDKSTCCARPLYKFLPPIERATTTRRKVYAVLSHSMSPWTFRKIYDPLPPPFFRKLDSRQNCLSIAPPLVKVTPALHFRGINKTGDNVNESV